MRDDPIVEETRAARRELHDEFAGDTAAFFRYLKKVEAENVERLITTENVERLITTEPKAAITPNRKVS